jgi:hypothetical protein
MNATLTPERGDGASSFGTELRPHHGDAPEQPDTFGWKDATERPLAEPLPGGSEESPDLVTRVRTTSQLRPTPRAHPRDGPLHSGDAPFGEHRHGARANRRVLTHARTVQPHRFPARGHRPRTPEAKGCLRAGVSRTPRSLRCSRGRSRPWAWSDDRDRLSSGSVMKRRTEPR